MPDPNAFVQICPSRPLLARVGEKWSVLALVAMEDGPLRFGELRRRLEGVSQKMLTQTLRNLERDGLVARRLFDERPLRVEYSVTPLGESLAPLVKALKDWSEAHLHDTERAQKKYDRTEAKNVR